MAGQEAQIKAYFSEVVEHGRGADLEDATNLIYYCVGAAPQHATYLTVIDVRRLCDSLTLEVERRLGLVQSPGSKCELLNTLGRLRLIREFAGEAPEGISGMETWLQLTELVDRAPMFPLDRFADVLATMIPLIGAHPDYDTLARRIDVLLSQRVGEFAAAEKCRDRALAFHEQGQILRAISELHQAKVKWFTKETLRGSVLSMLFIAHCYSELGLFYAAKYYDLAASWIAIESDDAEVQRLAPQAMIAAAECDYRLGNWIGWLRLMDIAVMFHWQFAPSPDDFDSNPELRQIWFDASYVSAASERLDPSLAEVVHGVVSNWGWYGEIEFLVGKVHTVWSESEASAFQAALDRELGTAIFGDLTDEREANWHELGIAWRVHWQNDYETTVAAEQLIATLQVAVTDFAKHDMLLLATDVDITVSVGDVESPLVEPIPSNKGRKWTVVLPRHQADDQSRNDWQRAVLAGVGIHCLREVSLAPHSEFMSILEEVVRDGMMAKVFVARPYERLYRDVLPEESSPTLTYEGPPILRMPRHVCHPAPHPELAWIDRTAPGYSKQESVDAVQRRYSRIVSGIPVTLARLNQSIEFKEIVAILRTEGWLDWHILLAVANIATNIRATQRYGSHWLIPSEMTKEDMAKHQSQFMEVGFDLDMESQTALDLEAFSLDSLRQHLDFSMGATLKAWGLECHQETPDIPAIREFLAKRYNYWSDDVDHADPFDADGHSGIVLLPSVTD